MINFIHTVGVVQKRADFLNFLNWKATTLNGKATTLNGTLNCKNSIRNMCRNTTPIQMIEMIQNQTSKNPNQNNTWNTNTNTNTTANTNSLNPLNANLTKTGTVDTDGPRPKQSIRHGTFSRQFELVIWGQQPKVSSIRGKTPFLALEQRELKLERRERKWERERGEKPGQGP